MGFTWKGTNPKVFIYLRLASDAQSLLISQNREKAHLIYKYPEEITINSPDGMDVGLIQNMDIPVKPAGYVPLLHLTCHQYPGSLDRSGQYCL